MLTDSWVHVNDLVFYLWLVVIPLFQTYFQILPYQKKVNQEQYNWSLTPLLCTALDQRANSLEKKTLDVLLVVASLAKKWLEFVCVSRLSENWQKQNYLCLSFYWCWLKGWSKLVVFRYDSKHWLWVCRYELPSSWYWKSLLWICR